MIDEKKVLNKKIADLEKEIKELRSSGGGLTLFAGSISKSTNKDSMTIVGLEEMVLLLGKEETIGYINGPMSRFMGIKNKKSVIGKSLSNHDKIPGAEGLFHSLASMGLGTGEVVTIEPSFEDFEVERLPENKTKRPAGSVFVRFSVTKTEDNIQILAQETTHLKWLEKNFSRYVSPQVMNKLHLMNEKDLMQPERINVTVLFGDLRGFTSMSEKLPPEKVSRIISSFLGEMVEAVNEYEGTVDKFVGDEIMAIFGAPQSQPDHAIRAVATAVKMLERHSLWKEDQKKKGLPFPDVGIGLATGEVVVGNIGTEERSDYTAIGHTVNLAARLCDAVPGATIYTVQSTYDSVSKELNNSIVKLPKLSFTMIGAVKMKNVSEPVKILRVEPKQKTQV